MEEDNYKQLSKSAMVSWNSFVSMIRQDVDNLINERRKLKLEQRKLMRIQKILQYQGNDINTFLQHKDSILSVDASLAKSFSILEAFKKRENLNNDVAIRIYEEIINSESLKEKLTRIDQIQENVDTLNDKIANIIRLIHGEVFDFELISSLCEEHNIPNDQQVKILLYPVTKVAKKTVKKEEDIPLVEETTNDLTETQTVEKTQEDTSIFEMTNISEEPTINEENKNRFLILKENYNNIIHDNNELLNKYYNVLKELSNLEKDYYRILCSKSEDFLLGMSNEQLANECNYEEPLAKAFAMKIFEVKNSIDELMKIIPVDNYQNDGDIDLLEEFIKIYASFIDKLKMVEPKIVEVETAEEALNNKAFVLVDENGKPFISQAVISEYHTNIATFIQKVQNETNIKKSNRVVRLKGVENLENSIGKTIFLSINSRVLISFIRLRMADNNEGVIIITAIPASKNIIKEVTDEVVKNNFERLTSLITAIEKGDESQLIIQDNIVSDLLKGGKK